MQFLLGIIGYLFVAVSAQWGPNSLSDNSKHGAVISATSGYPELIHNEKPKEENVYHSSYKAISDYEHFPEHKDTIFTTQRYDPHDPKYKALRKAYDDYIANKIALKKRIFHTILKKTVDKTVDVTASLTKHAVDFISKLSIDTAANLAKSGAHAVIHKKEDKFHGNGYHH